MNLWNQLKGKKTYIVTAATLLYAVLVLGWGDNNWSAVLPYVFGGLGGATLRHAISTELGRLTAVTISATPVSTEAMEAMNGIEKTLTTPQQ